MPFDEANAIALIKSNIKSFPDFPKPGVLFRDIFSALSNREVCIAIRDLLLNYIRRECPDIDVIVGLEARGFLFSFMIAAELGIGCAAIRKKGKLPGKVIEKKYDLEYGTDTIEIQENSIKKGQKILIVDDLLATGGTFQAAAKLVQDAGGILIKCIAIIELLALGGRKKVDCDVHTFIQYEN